VLEYEFFLWEIDGMPWDDGNGLGSVALPNTSPAEMDCPDNYPSRRCKKALWEAAGYPFFLCNDLQVLEEVGAFPVQRCI
jgi:hypothetical protein